MNQKHKFLKTYLVTAAITLAVGAGLFCLFFFLHGRGLRGACDGTGYPGIILTGIAGLIFVARNGFFDIFSYGFKQLGSSMFGRNANKYKDFPDYKNQNREVRSKRSKYYLIILFIGLAFIIASIGCLIAFNSVN